MTSAGRPCRPRPSRSAALDDPAAPLATIDAFLREFPETPRRAEALALARSLKDELAKRQTRRRAAVRRRPDPLRDRFPTVSLADQIERARQFLAEHPESAVRGRGRQPARDVPEAARRARHRAGPRLLATESRPSSRPGSSAFRIT